MNRGREGWMKGEEKDEWRNGWREKRRMKGERGEG